MNELLRSVHNNENFFFSPYLYTLYSDLHHEHVEGIIVVS